MSEETAEHAWCGLIGVVVRSRSALGVISSSTPPVWHDCGMGGDAGADSGIGASMSLDWGDRGAEEEVEARSEIEGELEHSDTSGLEGRSACRSFSWCFCTSSVSHEKVRDEVD